MLFGTSVFVKLRSLERSDLLLSEEILNSLVDYHLLGEDISAGLRRLNHLDDLREALALTLLESSDSFLCHRLTAII